MSSAYAGHYGLAAPLYGSAVSAPLAYGGALIGAPAIASIPAYGAPLLAGPAIQTGDYSRVSTIHGIAPGIPTLASPIGATYAAPLTAGLVHAPVAARLGAPLYSPYGLGAPLAHAGAIRLIK